MASNGDYESERDGPSPEGELAERAEVAEGDDRRAHGRDVDAAAADRAAIARDQVAEVRDTEAAERDLAAGVGTYPPSGFADRRRARSDRADAATDRARAAADRERARADRLISARQRGRAGDDRTAAYVAVGLLRELLARAEDKAEHMNTIGKAQAMIMVAQDCGRLEAMLELTGRAVRDHTEIEAAAKTIIRERAD